MPVNVGQIEAVLDAIGESDNEIGGLHQTRLAATVQPKVSLGAPFVWNGTDTVTTPDTSEVSVGDYIGLDEDGTRFEITAITPNTDVTLDTTPGTPPTGPTAVALGITYTWDGSTTILASDTSEVGVGVWIRLDADGQWFKITSVDTDTSVTIENPFSLTVPSGATQSSKSTNPVTVKFPNSISVETCLNWPDSGKFSLGGVKYTYGSKTLSPASLDEVTHQSAGSTVVGIKIQHNALSPVTDISRERSEIEKTRRAMLVEYASGEDLNTIGRNYGVNRFPFLGSDDIFREIVKALAYNPKGTMFGLELALTALLGEGNFDIYEDLITYPNTVFIRVLGGPFTSDSFEGKAFLSGAESQPATSDTTVDILRSVADRGHIHSVRLKDENHLSDFRNQLPSAETLAEYIGDYGTTLWYYVGNNEGTEVTQLSNDEGIEIIDGSASDHAKYVHPARIVPESYASVRLLTYFDSSGTWDGSVASQWGVRIDDGAFWVAWGTVNLDANNVRVGLTTGATLLGGLGFPLAKDTYHEIELRKYGTDRVQLWVNGVLRLSRTYADFTTVVSEHNIQFGSISDAVTAQQARVKQVGYYIHTATDYWGSQGSEADVATANPTRVSGITSIALADPGDEGKRFVIKNSGITNAYGGNNNGVFEIDSLVSADAAELKGEDQTGATLQSANPLRIMVSGDGQKFKFPDDLGKTLVISGSSQGNDGSYTIKKLIDDLTDVDLGPPRDLSATYTWDGTTTVTTTDTSEVKMNGWIQLNSDGQWFRIDAVTTDTSITISNPFSFSIPSGSSTSSFTEQFITPTPQETTVAEVESATFVSESNVSWRLDPAFETESNVDWELSDTGSFSGTTLTLRQDIPVPDPASTGAYTRVLDVAYSQVLSAQVLLDITIDNLLTQEIPTLEFSHYPFYLSDPLGFVRHFVDEVTAAGVIPEFLED